ncbi:MAG: dethiobiotin synthase [Rahnella inusitata]|jgi:dethiobiotin synthetase|uniref:ATP-dependent dethiobiotin synthetase BioD n=1 Tax=Rahnella inusitata TaxID=58169 RepID=A0ABX9P4W3_9GAMM|nr:dethiobiotin synthase [Rahnella inusitata]NMC24958.1 ATP-dependent dethiobiotin synthetase BioD [Serratia sp. (in: enterobacteria)]QUT16809.1 ATP-dependent dethiobiotin synthetase BioD [Rahnella inusitata]RJT15783.1 ATP-dependent dethiobiotin synthetase BioD [Rahnella inusitata]
MKKYFITGTDTEVGKTVSTTAFLQAAARAGHTTAGYKPVASGSEMTAEGPRNSDALALQAFSTVGLRYDEVNPCTFIEPTSPHIVSELEKCPIDPAVLSAGLRHLEPLADWVVVEGAGGWYTPLTAEFTFADWVVAEQLPVVLVVGMRLGCINHAVLTAQAITQSGLQLAGWIANDVQETGKHHQAYMDTLTRMLPAPLLGEIPYLSAGPDVNLGQYLDLGRLSH